MAMTVGAGVLGCVNSFRLHISTFRTTDLSFGTPQVQKCGFGAHRGFEVRGGCSDSGSAASVGFAVKLLQ
jgi:hypothetical protein